MLCFVQRMPPKAVSRSIRAANKHLTSSVHAMQEGGERQPAAFVHYRWEEEDARPVLYCYDIQLEPRVQRKGLGRRAPRRAVHLQSSVAVRLRGALVLSATWPCAQPCSRLPADVLDIHWEPASSPTPYIQPWSCPGRRFLMKLLELAARRAGVDALMLTVMDANAGARAMYAPPGLRRA